MKKTLNAFTVHCAICQLCLQGCWHTFCIGVTVNNLLNLDNWKVLHCSCNKKKINWTYCTWLYIFIINHVWSNWPRLTSPPLLIYLNRPINPWSILTQEMSCTITSLCLHYVSLDKSCGHYEWGFNIVQNYFVTHPTFPLYS